MGKQEFHAIQCSHCGLHQVQQVKKNPQFKCTVCNKQQKLLKEHFRGPAKQCREIVQSLNRALHEGDIPFTPMCEQPTPQSAKGSSEKRKSASDPESNDPKRLKDAKSTKGDSRVDVLPGNDENERRMSGDDDEPFPLRGAAKLELPSNKTTLPNTPSLIELSGASDVKYEDDDDDDDIFGDIPSPRKTFHSEPPTSGHGPPPSNAPETSLPLSEQPLDIQSNGSGEQSAGEIQRGTSVPMDDEDDIFDDIPSPRTLRKESPESSCQPLPRNEEVSKNKVSTTDEEIHETSPKRGGKANDKNVRVTVSRPTAEQNPGKTSEELGSAFSSKRRVSVVEKTEVVGVAPVREAWRRRSLTKLAKYKFDPDDDSPKAETIEKAIPTVTDIPPAAREPPGSGAPPETCVTLETIDSEREKTEIPPETSKSDQSVSSPGGRDRFLATLQRFKRAPSAK